MTRTDLIGTIAEYSNDLFEGESHQRWKSVDEVVDHILATIKAQNCLGCKHRDTQRPHDHPNWRECNNRDSIMSYQETKYDWCCKDWEQK